MYLVIVVLVCRSCLFSVLFIRLVWIVFFIDSFWLVRGFIRELDVIWVFSSFRFRFIGRRSFFMVWAMFVLVFEGCSRTFVI